ncbi:hypothetical protein NIIDMKKI_32980 [Mycobacterium kansasii]|uniref:Uncharacterized protein n=1 Tax=Mycobacterium kansasii TaxID=1768 RepID=A0A7G1IDY0_MYCKA|nr:hypothetical protein NIIDMKKI_32980 [Mycobacterium kansasii]
MTRGLAGGNQVALEFGLSVHPHAATNQVDEVKTLAFVFALQINSAMLDSVFGQPPAQPHRLEELDGAVVQDAGADAP